MAELEVKRSRFIAAAAPTATLDEGARFVAGRRKDEPDARHTVFATLLRDGSARKSDDGEPSGTGGTPVLEVIKQRGLCDITVAVTRYFGGVLLGAGGLLRAYSGAAALALDEAEPVTYTECVEVALSTPYHRYELVNRLLPARCRTISSTFEKDVLLVLLMPASEYGDFCGAVREATGAAVVPQVVKECFAAL